MLSARLIALHSTYLNLINKLLSGAFCASYIFREVWVGFGGWGGGGGSAPYSFIKT